MPNLKEGKWRPQTSLWLHDQDLAVTNYVPKWLWCYSSSAKSSILMRTKSGSMFKTKYSSWRCAWFPLPTPKDIYTVPHIARNWEVDGEAFDRVVYTHYQKINKYKQKIFLSEIYRWILLTTIFSWYILKEL